MPAVLSKRVQYNLQDLKNAVECVKDGTLSYGEAAKAFDVPKGTNNPVPSMIK